MLESNTTKTLAKVAAKAHTDLNIFAAVQSLMESSLVSSDSHADEARIVSLARAAQQRCLKRYDNAMAALAAKPQ